jgi:uncharacterized damage-inducible protein DinB
MEPLQPEQAHYMLNAMYLPVLASEHTITQRMIQAIPRDKGDYRPDEISKSALELAWHIAVSEMRFMDAVLTGSFDTSPRPRPESIKNSEDLAGWYAQNFESHVQELKKLSNEQLVKVIDFRGMFQRPAVVFLGILLHHSVHHRGQLSMYLRPMGAKVPSIYGESYDSAMARKSA